MKCDLSGKVSLVTGAARGIGKAIADRLAANGSTVFYTDRDADDVRQAAAGQRWLRLDVTDPAEIAAAVQQVESDSGRLDILVNGIAPGSTLTEGTRKLFYAEGGMFRDSVQRMLDHVPLGRPAEVDEIAVAALFLADPENTYMNGHILVVDGGWTAGYARDF